MLARTARDTGDEGRSHGRPWSHPRGPAQVAGPRSGRSGEGKPGAYCRGNHPRGRSQGHRRSQTGKPN
eukprot:15351812-Alexandrium_andersonii.AAC.1